MKGIEARGAQFAGVGNIVGRDLDGFQISGGLNAVGRDVEGFQASAWPQCHRQATSTASKWQQESTPPVEVSGAFKAAGGGNFAGRNLQGLQITSGLNLVGRNVLSQSLQIAAGLNIAGNLEGTQISAATNIALGWDQEANISIHRHTD